LKDLGILGMAVEEFWQDCDKDYTLFEYGKPKETRICEPHANKPIRIEPSHKREKCDVQMHE
jgi:hypothetical protein